MATATTKTWAIQGENSPAQAGRILATMLVTEGVFDVDGDAFLVAEDTGANMQVKVGSGTVGDLAAVDGDTEAGQGLYLVRHSNATQTLVVPAADSSNDRIDRVILRIYDDESDSSGNSYADLEIVEGTPAGTPSAPDIPDSAISLATIEVGAGVSAITDADITSTRTELVTRGQHVETVTYTANGTFKKADYPWLRKIVAKVQGSGGSGAGALSTGGQYDPGRGGSAGGYAETAVDVADLAASETITVGAAVTGGVGASDGSNGNASSFGTHAIGNAGAGGGRGGSGTALQGFGGVSGGSGTGDIVIPGGPGYAAVRLSTTEGIGSEGGDSYLGRGGRARNPEGNGFAAVGYGSGGGGAADRSATSRTGGTSGAGIVIIELYA